MAVGSDFRPRHEQPVTLAELSTLEPELLVNEITRLENSLKHLRRSNDELEEFARDEEDPDTKAEFVNTVWENRETIEKQEERIEMMRLALQEQIGVQATNGHYAPNRPFDQPTSPSTTLASTGGEEEEEEVTGMAGATRRREQQVNSERPVVQDRSDGGGSAPPTDEARADEGDEVTSGLYL